MRAKIHKSNLFNIILLAFTLMQAVSAMPSPEAIAKFQADYKVTLDNWLETKTN